jgi:hypothetical protein
MALRIERSERQGLTIFALSGRIEAEHISELGRLFGPRADYAGIVVDLSEVRLADRAAVRFLARCEVDGVRLENCPEYIREWITRENAQFDKRKTMEEEKD